MAAAGELEDRGLGAGAGGRAQGTDDCGIDSADGHKCFLDPIRSAEHGPGRDAEDPALLLCLWVYGYSEGIGSARELARRMEYDPALLWILGGREAVCHSKLSEFRTGHPAALGKLFVELLAMLESGGWVDFAQVMQDGSKLQAHCGTDTFRSSATIEQKLATARAAIERLSQQEYEPEWSARTGSAARGWRKLGRKSSGGKPKSRSRNANRYG